MAEEADVTLIDSDEPESTPGYVPLAPKTLDDIKNMDEDDESLVKYKQTLLSDEGASPADDPRKVIVEKMSLVVAGRDDVVLDLTGDMKSLQKMIVKEGVEYKIKVDFKIPHEIVCGLRYHHAVQRKGVSVDKQSYMVGSYGPKKDTQSWSSPADEAPKGIMCRGTYKVKSKFIDDEKNIHLKWEWEMEIKKDWEN